MFKNAILRDVYPDAMKIANVIVLFKSGIKGNPNNYRPISLLSNFIMPPPLGAGDIMFSGCPSVRPKPEIPSFDLYMGPLVHPTNRNRFTACPSVRLSVRPSVRRGFRAFARERMEGMARNFT